LCYFSYRSRLLCVARRDNASHAATNTQGPVAALPGLAQPDCIDLASDLQPIPITQARDAGEFFGKAE